MLKATSYSTYIAAAVRGAPQRGIVHSAFDAAANIVFPGDFVLSLNATSSSSVGGSAKRSGARFDPSSPTPMYWPEPRMPNGLQLNAPPGTFPFTALRAGMPVLFGAQRLLIEPIDCSLDLSLCSQWNPHIERPPLVDMEIVRKNRERLRKYLNENEQDEGNLPLEIAPTLAACIHPDKHSLTFPYISKMARFLCGRGVGLTPTGDDMLASWMAAGWLLYGPVPGFLAACQQILEVTKQQTHLLSQCWLSYAAQGNVALPIRTLLEALTRDDESELSIATQAVLAIGATSGYDLIQGIVLMLMD